MSKKLNEVVAVFDFDGTLTVQDTFNDFLAYRYGRSAFYWEMFLQSKTLLLYLLKKVPNCVPKENMLRRFCKGVSLHEFQDHCKEYASTRLPQLERREAIEKLRWHQLQKHTVVIVSASLGDWITPWAKAHKIDQVIASKPEVKLGKLTGNIVHNCYGETKKSLFLKKFPNRKEYSLYVYGDSQGDHALLEIADYAYYKKFS